MNREALHIPMRPHDGDIGPYRLNEVRAVWIPIARTIDVLHGLGACGIDAVASREIIDAAVIKGDSGTVLASVALALRILSAQEGMHALDWLRMRAIDEQMPRRKPPAAVDLQLRLKGLQCKRLVAHCDPDGESYRVTIQNTRGDVASVNSSSFASALEGAMRMAGARMEGS